MNRNIAFVGIFYLTDTYMAIADILLRNDCNVFWFIPDTTHYRIICTKYGKDSALLIDEEWLNSDFVPIDDFKINEIVYNDRVYKHDLKKGIAYLEKIQRPIYDFIKKNNIQTIIGENSINYTLLIARMCKWLPELGCEYFSICITRIPNNRFFFVSDERFIQIWQGKKAKDSLDDSVFRVQKPDYFNRINAFASQRISYQGIYKRAKRFLLKKDDPTDPNTITDRWIRFFTKTKDVIEQQTYRFVKKETLENYKDKPYIFYGFHKQPESSVDVCGRYEENQFQTVLNIWRQLPSSWFLLVKEHTNALGDRTYAFYKKLKHYPNIVILDERINSYDIIDHAQIIIANTGTVAMEAALKGVPSITLSKVWFNDCISYCRHYSWLDLEMRPIEKIIEDIKAKPLDISEYKDLIMKYSFRGSIGDPISIPGFLDDKENIKSLADAIFELILR